MTPEEVLAKVNSRETFLEFLKLLENDFSAAVLEEAKNSSSLYGPDAHGWENITIDKFTIAKFLGAARAWADDSDESESLLGNGSQCFFWLGKVMSSFYLPVCDKSSKFRVMYVKIKIGNKVISKINTTFVIRRYC